MLFTKTDFSKLAHTPSFMANVALIVADEAHCITQWSGKSFRPLFAELGSLRSLVDIKVPVLACSATMTPDVLQAIKASLALRPDATYVLNLGNDRRNITPLVVKIKSNTDWDALSFLVDGAPEDRPLLRVLIYVLKKDDAQDVCLHLRNKLLPGSPLRSQINFISAARDVSAKVKVMEDYRKGKVNILIATEVAGMVCTLISAFAMLIRPLGLGHPGYRPDDSNRDPGDP